MPSGDIKHGRNKHREIKGDAPGGASGRFVLRIPPNLHLTLRAAAREAGLSLNDYCCRRLAAPSGSVAPPDEAVAAVARATGLFGDRLVGVVAYGSWARGEALRDSDVDLLVVLDEGSAITRSLYRSWDEQDLAIDGRPVEPHFVKLHDDGGAWTGLWAEAARDGIVLFERRLAVSRHLARVRSHVMSGRLVRKTVHGQPYWSEVA